MSELSLLIQRRDVSTDQSEIDQLSIWIHRVHKAQELAKSKALKELVAAGYAASDPSVQYRAEVFAGIRD